MSAAKHTPGPWRLHAMEPATLVAGKPGVAIADFNARDRSDAENEANARAAALAPEALRALQLLDQSGVLSRAEAWSSGMPYWEQSRDAIEAARLVLGRADMLAVGPPSIVVELLEALRSFVTIQIDGRSFIERLEAGRAAIAKAEGRA